jgi:O-antigen/teichoic acid export membrane protein
MTSSLKSKAVDGLLWSCLDRFGQRTLFLLISIILARLLLPEDFGLIGMLAIFTAIAQVFLECSFGQALIQKKDATHVDACSVFYVGILVGLAAAGSLCLLAPWVADFYRQPLLTELMRVMSLNIAISSFGLAHRAILMRRIDFETQTKISLIAMFLSGATGVALAVVGFGVWSLAIQQVCNNLCQTVLVWLFSAWRPSLVFSLTALRSMFCFGSRLLASGLLNTVFENLYFVVIGRLFSAADLGIYSRARTMQRLPALTFSEVVTRVIFPVFSTVQDDPRRLKRGVRKVLTATVLVHFPMMIGLAVVARPLVLVLLTEKWLPCVAYMQLLCIVGLSVPLHVVNLDVLKAKGRSDLFLRVEILKKIAAVAAIVVTYRWGIRGIIYGQIAVSVVAYYLNSYYTGVLIRYPIREQLVDLLPYMVVAGLMGAGVYALGLLPFPNNWTLLICQVAAGVLLYLAICASANLAAFQDVLHVVKPRLAALYERWSRTRNGLTEKL